MRSLIVLGLAAGCFRPDPVTGSPCDDELPCPNGLVCTLGHCQRDPGNAGADAQDAPDPGDGGGLCFGSGLVRVCLQDAPTAAIAIDTATTLDTNASALCVASDRPELCVVAATTISVSGTLRAIGARPLALVASSGIAIMGVVDVASHRADGSRGAGADGSDCTTPPVATQTGGPGGSFGGSGGDGGGGSMGLPAGPPAGALTGARGGCPGTAGGDASGTGGAAGHGGGAVALIAPALDIQGTVNASGAGGGGGTIGGFGGGGGSGGLIILDASVIQIAVAASVFANGGGGGAAGQLSNGNPGADPKDPATPASGGTGISGSGGAGAAGVKLDGGAGQTFGGGGGGAAGLMRVFGGGAVTGGNVSPPAS